MSNRNVGLPGGECLIAGEAPGPVSFPNLFGLAKVMGIAHHIIYAPKFPPLYTKRDFLVPDKYNWPYA
ncbi:hypothetical protein M758_2G175600 [Ceratodon purpureus]|nr:hypothetical protein M758_2G175600 [Ceratodon purpureus]